MDVVATALRGLQDRGRVVVEVSPEDIELVKGAIAGIAEAEGLARVDVVPERRVDRGGCLVHTDEAEIDATATAQLARAAEIVRDAIGPAA